MFIVILLFLLANVAYFSVLSFGEITQASTVTIVSQFQHSSLLGRPQTDVLRRLIVSASWDEQVESFWQYSSASVA
jgi:hypothetical protein